MPDGLVGEEDGLVGKEDGLVGLPGGLVGDEDGLAGHNAESKFTTDTPWLYLARIILSTSFHCPVRGSNSRISGVACPKLSDPPKFLFVVNQSTDMCLYGFFLYW